MRFWCLLMLTWIAALLSGVAAQPDSSLSYDLLAGDRATPQALYLATSEGSNTGFFKSVDQGATWNPLYLTVAGSAQPKVYALAIHPNNTTLWAGTDVALGGVWRSTDSGATWKTSATGVSGSGSAVERLFLSPKNPQVLYAKAGRNIFKTTNGGDSWTLKGTLPENVTANAFAVNMGDSTVMYAGGLDAKVGSRMYRSGDEGGTWKQVGAIARCYNNDFNDAQYSVTHVVTPDENPSVVYAATASGSLACLSDGATVTKWCDTFFKSRDDGATFTPVFQPWRVASSTLDADRPDTVYLRRAFTNCSGEFGFATPKDPAHDIFISRNAGVSWSGADMPSTTAGTTGYSAQEMAYGDSPHNVLFTPCSLGGVCRSTDGGSTWTRLNVTFHFTLPKPDTIAFTLAPGDKGSYDYNGAFLESPKASAPIQATASGGGWLSVAAGATMPATVRIYANATGLSSGSYQGTVRISGTGAVNDPLSIPVSLTVAASTGPQYTASLVAGVGVKGFSGDQGLATQAQLYNPTALWLDTDGTLYIADFWNSRVRKVTKSGFISTVAGTGKEGFGGDGGPATSADLNDPSGLTMDGAGNLYIADSYNHRIRKVARDGATISTWVNVPNTLSAPCLPKGIAFDPAGRMVVACGSIATDRQVLSLSSSGQSIVLASALSEPNDVAVGPNGKVYAANTAAHTVVSLESGGSATIVAGNGTGAYTGDGPARSTSLNNPMGLAFDSAGNLFIADSWNGRIRRLGTDGKLVTVAGGGTDSKLVSGPATSVKMVGPERVIVDASGNLYVSDTLNYRVLKFTLQSKPAINAGGIVNVASYTAPVAPGSIAAVFGNFLQTHPTIVRDASWPPTVSGVSLQFAGRDPAHLYATTQGQVNLQVPWEVSTGTQTLTVTVNGQTSDPQMVNVAQYAPGIFSTNAQGTGQGSIIDLSWKLVDQNNPAVAGATYLQIYCTGLGPVTDPPASGEAAPSDRLVWATTKPVVTIGGVQAEVSFWGLAPGLIGMYQVNAKVPATSALGNNVPVVISVGGATSNTVTVPVRAGP